MGLSWGTCGIPDQAHEGEGKKKKEGRQQPIQEGERQVVLKGDMIKPSLNFTVLVRHQGLVPYHIHTGPEDSLKQARSS